MMMLPPASPSFGLNSCDCLPMAFPIKLTHWSKIPPLHLLPPFPHLFWSHLFHLQSLCPFKKNPLSDRNILLANLHPILMIPSFFFPLALILIRILFTRTFFRVCCLYLFMYLYFTSKKPQMKQNKNQDSGFTRCSGVGTSLAFVATAMLNKGPRIQWTVYLTGRNGLNGVPLKGKFIS